MNNDPNEYEQNEESVSSSGRAQTSSDDSKSHDSESVGSPYIQRITATFSMLKRKVVDAELFRVLGYGRRKWMLKRQVIDTGHLRSYLKFAPSTLFCILLVVFLISYGPVLLENPENITPDEETHSISISVGEGGHDGEVYKLENSEEEHVEFVAECNPEGNYLSTGGSFNCDYNVSSIERTGNRGLVEFDRDFLDRIGGEPLIIAKWKRISPEGETTYVTHRYGYSAEPTLDRTFKVYTPTEPGEYKFSLLVSTYLNPIGPEHPEENVVPTRSSNVYVYSEERAASFTISAATYRLEQVVIIGIAIGLLQLIFHTYPTRKD